MEIRRPAALLIGGSEQHLCDLSKHLENRGCESTVATSCAGVCSLVQAHEYDLALSPMRLRDTSMFPLIHLLTESKTTLFYYFPVENGCWWLPAVRCGRDCFGTPALRPNEFAIVLDDVIGEVLLGQRGTRGTRDAQLFAGRLPASVSVLPFPPAPPPSADSEQPSGVPLAKFKVAS